MHSVALNSLVDRKVRGVVVIARGVRHLPNTFESSLVKLVNLLKGIGIIEFDTAVTDDCLRVFLHGVTDHLDRLHRRQHAHHGVVLAIDFNRLPDEIGLVPIVVVRIDLEPGFCILAQSEYWKQKYHGHH